MRTQNRKCTQNTIKKKSSIFSFPPNYQRISNKESLVTAHFRNLPSLEPEVRCLRRQIHLSGSLTFPFILNIGQTELSSTSIASNVDTRYFRQNFPPLPSPRLHTHTHTHTTHSFSKRSTRPCSGDFVKQSIKARCRQIYGGSVVAFPARKQLKFMPTAWIIRFPSRDRNAFSFAPRWNSIEKSLRIEPPRELRIWGGGVSLRVRVD